MSHELIGCSKGRHTYRCVHADAKCMARCQLLQKCCQSLRVCHHDLGMATPVFPNHLTLVYLVTGSYKPNVVDSASEL